MSRAKKQLKRRRHKDLKKRAIAIKQALKRGDPDVQEKLQRFLALKEVQKAGEPCSEDYSEELQG